VWGKPSIVFLGFSHSNSFKYENLFTALTLDLWIVSAYKFQNLGQSEYLPLNSVIWSFGNLACSLLTSSLFVEVDLPDASASACILSFAS
jgi:hypothetical protein